MADIIHGFSVWLVPLLLAIIIHEVAHGFVAMKLGDYTAKFAGRLTMNPKEHIDPIGTLLIPGVLLLIKAPFLIGWAKPVPIDSRNFKHPKRDMGLVAAAGPLSNFLLFVIFLILFHVLYPLLPKEHSLSLWVSENLLNGMLLSLVLCVFNLIPILPLDGGRILASVLPVRLSYEYQKTEAYGFWILIGILFLLPMIGIDPIGWLLSGIGPFVTYLINF